MIKDLQDLFKRSWAAFVSEVSRREPEDQVAELLGAMRRELRDARALLPELEAELKHRQAELAKERQALADTERRRGLAEKIQDRETVRVAEEFAARHRERVAVLEQTVQAAEAELALRRREAEQMLRAYKDADANRWSLVARLRNQQAQRRLNGDAGALWSELERMEGKVQGDASYADALDELNGLDDSAPPRSTPSPDDVQRRLDELKRRMGKG